VEKDFRVRAVHCDYRASDEEVYQALKRATDPLTRTWEKLGRAGRIGIKFNHQWAPERVVMHEGHRQQLVSDPVARATLRLLRERTKAEIFVVDVGVEGRGHPPEATVQLLPVLREFDVPFISGHDDGVAWVDVPGGGQMFHKYPVPRSTVEADAMVSVQKLKNHLFAGDGANVMVQGHDLDAGDLLDHGLHDWTGRFNQMGPYLLQQVSPLLSRKRLD